MPKYIILTFSILLLSAVFFGARILPETLTSLTPIPTPTAKIKEDIPQVTIIARGLEVPWALAFLPDNGILVTERVGKVKIVKDGKVEEIAAVAVKQTGESGLHGIAVDPKYPEKPFVYLYYTYSADGNNSFNKVSRFEFSDQTLKDEQVLVDKIPGAIFHDGGRIRDVVLGPDNMIYITTSNRDGRGSPKTDDDKIIRINPKKL